MLVDFSVENYRSVKDRVTLSLVAADKLKARERRLDQENRCRVFDDLSLLRSVVIYGANASGKSNLFRAFRFMRTFILSSSRDSQADDLIDVEHFRLGGRTADIPSEFEVIFILGGIQYRYGFSASSTRIDEEWLYYVPASREVPLFSRIGDAIEIGEQFKEGEGLPQRTRQNALFLSVVAQFNGDLAQRILRWFGHATVLSEDRPASQWAMRPLAWDKPERIQRVVEFIKRLDLGIEDIRLEDPDSAQLTLLADMPESRRVRRPQRIVSIHRTYLPDGSPGGIEEFDFARTESAGTRKLLYYADILLEALQHGYPVWIDELDARLHPHITLAILRLFNSSEGNPHGAQLIFTTHDTNLLSNRELRRDQVWFVEKDQYGTTRLYSLAEYRVRNDASFETDYIRGKYGAVPFVGDLAALIDDEADGKMTMLESDA